MVAFLIKTLVLEEHAYRTPSFSLEYFIYVMLLPGQGFYLVVEIKLGLCPSLRHCSTELRLKPLASIFKTYLSFITTLSPMSKVQGTPNGQNTRY